MGGPAGPPVLRAPVPTEERQRWVTMAHCLGLGLRRWRGWGCTCTCYQAAGRVGAAGCQQWRRHAAWGSGGGCKRPRRETGTGALLPRPQWPPCELWLTACILTFISEGLMKLLRPPPTIAGPPQLIRPVPKRLPLRLPVPPHGRVLAAWAAGRCAADGDGGGGTPPRTALPGGRQRGVRGKVWNRGYGFTPRGWWWYPCTQPTS